jgi:hypothetical protein
MVDVFYQVIGESSLTMFRNTVIKNSVQWYFQQYFSYIVVVNFIGGRNRSTLRKSWSWSHGSWIYNYLCNQCISPLTLWIQISFRRGVLIPTLCDTVCQIGICATHSALMNKNKDCFARNQNNMFEWYADMSTHGLLIQKASTITV